MNSIKYLFLMLVMLACDSEMADNSICLESNLSVTVTQTQSDDCGVSGGFIEAEASGGMGAIEYSLDGVNFQSSGMFNDVKPGKYSVIARDENNCLESTEVTLLSGISFAEKIKPIITSSCAVSGCHVTGEQAPDFTDESNIFSAAPRIKSQVETGAMPFGDDRFITSTEIEYIICWFNDGAKNN